MFLWNLSAIDLSPLQYCFFAFLALVYIGDDIMFALAVLKAAAIIHASLLNSIVRLPLRFFDVTPLGRILSRFSTDVNSVDTYLPYIMQGIMALILRVGNK